eukprot:1190086-Prorocentrum_minimum.AAC.2
MTVWSPTFFPAYSRSSLAAKAHSRRQYASGNPSRGMPVCRLIFPGVTSTTCSGLYATLICAPDCQMPNSAPVGIIPSDRIESVGRKGLGFDLTRTYDVGKELMGELNVRVMRWLNKVFTVNSTVSVSSPGKDQGSA